jgi:hypothetical protein
MISGGIVSKQLPTFTATNASDGTPWPEYQAPPDKLNVHNDMRIVAYGPSAQIFVKVVLPEWLHTGLMERAVFCISDAKGRTLMSGQLYREQLRAIGQAFMDAATSEKWPSDFEKLLQQAAALRKNQL